MKTAFAILLCIGLWTAGPVRDAAAEVATAKDLAAFSIDTLDDGSFQLADQRGKWVIVNYWATWCSPCIEEMPAISALDAEREDVVAIGLAFDSATAEELRAFLDKHTVVYPIARVDTMSPPAAFGAPRGLPTTYLIAPDGSLAKKFVGPITRADLERAIGKPTG